MEQIFYPKQLLTNKHQQKENQCFFAMPFSEQYTNLYNMLCIYLENEQYTPIRVDKNCEAGVPIITLILNGIAQSQYIIVDISEPNANVFYELGIAQTLKEPNNIFIIKDNTAKTPFDIQHLQYISYDKNNLKQLAEELIKRLKACQYRNDFWNAIDSINIIEDKWIDDFVAYCIKLFSEENITFFTEVLSCKQCELISFSEKEKKLFFEYDKVIRREIANRQNEKNINMLFKLLNRLLLCCCSEISVVNYIQEFLSFSEYDILRKEQLCTYQTDMAIELALHSKLVDISLSWIIEYFQKSKSTKVDLNRYKLESFLMRSNNQVINEFIINAILSNNHYIREHMSDIAGEKNLLFAEENLIVQLKRETNIYTTASIMEALGKIHSHKGASEIWEWVDKNAAMLITNENYFVLKHARNALINIHYLDYEKRFDKKYYDVLRRNNAI